MIDIPTIRKGFLLWMGEQIDIEVKFLDCTIDSPMPKLPDCDVCVATEFFEHVFDPLKYLHEIDTSLRKNGLLITNVADHGKEFMHVSPNLKSLRKRISELKYDIIKENEIFNKS